jgi:hypothetical protein
MPNGDKNREYEFWIVVTVLALSSICIIIGTIKTFWP